MKASLLVALQKIIAAIIAMFMPATMVTVPVAEINTNYYDNPTTEVGELIEEDGEEEEPILNFDAISFDFADLFENDTLVEARDEEFEPVMTWDISEAEDNSVTMEFYETNDTDGLIDMLLGKVTALFAPITAYAADVALEGGANEYGNVDDNAQKYGVVYVIGNGEMRENIYTNFVDVDRYLDTTKALLSAAHDNHPIDVTYQGTDLLEVDATAVYTDRVTGEEVFIDENIREQLNPADMLKYVPTAIVFDEDSAPETISDNAFVFCSNVTRIDIPASVEEIGDQAFMYCTGLREVNFEEGSKLRTIGEDAFAYCTALREITLPETVEEIGSGAFYDMGANFTIYCTDDVRYGVINDYNVAEGVNIGFAMTAAQKAAAEAWMAE